MRFLFFIIGFLAAARGARAEVIHDARGYDIIRVPAVTGKNHELIAPAREYYTGLGKRTLKDFAPTAAFGLTLADCVDMPAHFSLVDEGLFDGINDQGQAGTCWAHDLSHVAFTYNAVSGISREKPSRQELTACDQQNGGVNGGNLYPDNGYQETHGQGREADFPYTSGSTGRNGACKAIPPLSKLPAYEMVPNGGAKAKLAACALWKYKSAAWATVAAGSNSDWNGGNAGLFARCNGSSTNHATAAVGYDLQGGTYVFVVANSWGQGWGDHGFYHITMGCDAFGEEFAVVKPKPAPGPGPTPGPPPPPPPPPPPAKWSCTVKSGVFWTHGYSETADTRDAAATAAMADCRSSGGFWCRAVGCQQL